MPADTTLDRTELVRQVKALYRQVAQQPSAAYHFPIGRPLAQLDDNAHLAEQFHITIEATNVDLETLQKHGPMSKGQLQAQIARETSLAAMDRALGELWSILKITRVDYRESEGVLWDVLYRWAPQQVRDGIQISQHEAISALLSKYLESVVAAEQEVIEQFFSHVASRSKIREAVNALLQARELSFLVVGTKSLIRMTPPPEQQRRRGHG